MIVQIFKIAGHAVAVAVLTVLTQLGGIAWLAGLLATRRLRVSVIVAVYASLSFATLWIAPALGRVPLPCYGDGSLRMGSWIYCVLNRQYVAPELRDVARSLSRDMADRFPGTVTLALDANFPYLDGFPLLPHLSHNDGRKLDLALYYRDGDSYQPGRLRSPIGYFAFEEGPTNCPSVWPTLRWDLAFLQSLWPPLLLDEARTTAALQLLSADQRVGRVFVEPHLAQRLGVAGGKLGFQGCRAARHDDHIHLQLRR